MVRRVGIANCLFGDVARTEVNPKADRLQWHVFNATRRNGLDIPKPPGGSQTSEPHPLWGMQLLPKDVRYETVIG